jgi:hypothetical protein
MSSIPTETKVHILANPPVGPLKSDTFKLTTRPLPELKDGQVLVKMVAWSNDPAQRTWMDGDTDPVCLDGSLPSLRVLRHTPAQADRNSAVCMLLLSRRTSRSTLEVSPRLSLQSRPSGRRARKSSVNSAGTSTVSSTREPSAPRLSQLFLCGMIATPVWNQS